MRNRNWAPSVSEKPLRETPNRYLIRGDVAVMDAMRGDPAGCHPKGRESGPASATSAEYIYLRLVPAAAAGP